MNGINDVGDNKIRLKWMHTSDIHGDLFGYDYSKNRHQTGGGVVSIYQHVIDNKKEYGDGLVVTDSGDCLQGTPLAYYYNFIDTSSSHLVAMVMNELGYVSGVMGNHDIEVGTAVFERWMRDLKFPILGANVINKQTGEPYLRPYIIIERKGVRIAIIGFVSPVIPYYQPSKLWPQLVFKEILPSANHWVEYVKHTEHPDLIVGVFHSGFDGGIIINGKCHENVVKDVAEQIPGFDLICYGHDHIPAIHVVKNAYGNNVVCMGALCKRGVFTEAEIELTIKNGKIESKSIIGRLKKSSTIDRPYSTLPNKRRIIKKYFSEVQKVAQWASSSLCYLTETIDELDGYFFPCKFTDIIHQTQLDMTGAEISLVTPFSYNSRLKKGLLKNDDLFPLLEYEEFVYMLSLRGDEIKKILEYSYGEWVYTMKTSKDSLLQRRHFSLIEIAKSLASCIMWKKFRWMNKLAYSAAGIVYTVDVSKPCGDRVAIISMVDKSPFRMDREYRVAINRGLFVQKNSCLSNGTNLSQEELHKRIISISDKALLYYMMDKLKNQKVLSPQLISQWRFVPETLAFPAIKKERRLIGLLPSN